MLDFRHYQAWKTSYNLCHSWPCKCHIGHKNVTKNIPANMAMIRMWRGRLVVTFWFVTKQSKAQQDPCMQSIYGLAEPTTSQLISKFIFSHRFYIPKLKIIRPSLAQSQITKYTFNINSDMQNSISQSQVTKCTFSIYFATNLYTVSKSSTGLDQKDTIKVRPGIKHESFHFHAFHLN